MSRLRTWAELHPEQGVELASRQVGEYDPPRPTWELSVWLDWTAWGLGPGVEREYGTPYWPDRLYLNLSLGPVSLNAVRTWNERPSR